MTERKRTARKLLVASIGIAAAAYTACGHTVGNLMAVEAGPPADGGNADVNPFAVDAGADAQVADASDAGSD